MAMTAEETAVCFTCSGEMLVGVLHFPDSPPLTGVVIVVGGPQYRVGSHREFLLMARELRKRGAAVLRFDCRGMGDSDGKFPGFEHIEADISAAVDLMMERCPTIRKLMLWGLCDATREICALARRDPRIAGVALLNPWVRTPLSHARAQLKHYYRARIFQGEFIRKIARGEIRLRESARGLLQSMAAAFSGNKAAGGDVADASPNYLAEGMAIDLQRYKGRILLVISGRDLTAREFEEAARASGKWRAILRETRLTERRLADADHTFSRRAWRDQVIEWTWEWLAAE